MTVEGHPGRPKKLRPEYVCDQLSRLERIFRWAIKPEDWRFMNRPMTKPQDPGEEAKRREEYSKLLGNLSYSDLTGHCDPAINKSLPASNYPDLILLWQYSEGILLPHRGESGKGLVTGVSEESVTAQRSEFARRLALYIVAAEKQTSVEYLTKLCRKWDPAPSPKQADLG
jgi:hypothetical protein